MQNKQKFAKYNKSKILIYSLSIIAVLLVLTFAIYAKLFILTKPKTADSQGWENRYYSAQDLSKYNGTNPKLPIYMGYEGKVYDVSSGAGFYGAGKTYNYLTGRDATTELNEVGVGKIIVRKYPVVGKIKN